MKAAETLVDFLSHEARTERERQMGSGQKEAIPAIRRKNNSGEEYDLPTEWVGQEVKSFGTPEM